MKLMSPLKYLLIVAVFSLLQDSSLLSQCSFTAVNNVIFNCSADETYSMSGDVVFNNPPAAGQMIVELCDGQQEIFNAPFVSPISFEIFGVDPSITPCSISLSFTNNPACDASIPFPIPNCGCLVGFPDDPPPLTGLVRGACDPATNLFEWSGDVQAAFIPPGAAQLIIEDCNGNSVAFNPPFANITNFTIPDVVSNGLPCFVRAYFVDGGGAEIGCESTVNLANAEPCVCDADAGTTTPVANGDGNTDYVLCFGDQITIATNGDHTDPNDLGPIGDNLEFDYQPSLVFLIYRCPPTFGITPNTDFPGDDPCLVGVINAPGGIGDVNNLNLINAFPPGTFTNNIVYFVQITGYHVTPDDVILNTFCWDIGDPVPVQYLNPIEFEIQEDCIANTAEITITGGWPEFNGADEYTASNLTPATASFQGGVNTTNHGGTITITGLQSGDNYSFDLVDGNGCPINITGGPFSFNNDLEMIDIDDYVACHGDMVNIDPFQANMGGATFAWVNNDTDLGMGMNGTGNIPGFIADNTTGTSLTSTIEVTPTLNGCEGQPTTFTVTVEPIPTISFSTDAPVGCSPLTANFTILSTVVPGSTCLWDFGNGNTSTQCMTPPQVYTGNGCFDVSLEVTTPAGCSSNESTTDFICVNPSPSADFIYSPTEVTISNSTVQFINRSSNANAYQWFFAGIGTSSNKNPIMKFPEEAGTYPVTLTAIADNGCTDVAVTDIIIEEELIFYVPNTFTPDGDGFNDIFLPIMTTGFEVQQYQLLIFNRWGEVIFESLNPFVGWDGSYRDNIMQDGTYVWKINLKKTATVETLEFYGHVNLLR